MPILAYTITIDVAIRAYMFPGIQRRLEQFFPLATYASTVAFCAVRHTNWVVVQNLIIRLPSCNKSGSDEETERKRLHKEKTISTVSTIDLPTDFPERWNDC